MFENFDWIQAMRSSPVMVIILFCSVLTAGFAIERTIYFWKRRGNAESLLASALVAVRSGNREEAIRVLSAHPHPMGPVGAEMVRSIDDPNHVAEEKLHIAMSEQRLALERNLGFLGTMGNTAPLIGLLGTVWGIMRAFHDMARTGSAGPSVVAAGVAEALFTTAASLVVAVPAVIIYNNFVRRVGVVLTVTENHARMIRMNGSAAASRGATTRAA
ncbi:MAG TPA: MotA/TolQ/ExbB proton channel family protein [Candidatus Eisenbacteria bacterium]|nr:MotA/TolQ/ExbB proton channel family protein [Candidatus Eisenbacteria bacterium]